MIMDTVFIVRAPESWEACVQHSPSLQMAPAHIQLVALVRQLGVISYTSLSLTHHPPLISTSCPPRPSVFSWFLPCSALCTGASSVQSLSCESFPAGSLLLFLHCGPHSAGVFSTCNNNHSLSNGKNLLVSCHCSQSQAWNPNHTYEVPSDLSICFPLLLSFAAMCCPAAWAFFLLLATGYLIQGNALHSLLFTSLSLSSPT